MSKPKRPERAQALSPKGEKRARAVQQKKALAAFVSTKSSGIGGIGVPTTRKGQDAAALVRAAGVSTATGKLSARFR